MNRKSSGQMAAAGEIGERMPELDDEGTANAEFDAARTGSPRFGASDDPVWEPDDERRERSRLLRAMRAWSIDSLEDLHDRSIQDPEWFWREVVKDLGLDFDVPFRNVREEPEGKPLPRWFTEGRINAAEICAHRHARGPLASKTAVAFEGDDGRHRAVTYAELDAEVRRFAANLSLRGIRRGDRVVLFLPAVPEAVIAFLACAMLGAISVPAFTGFGAEGLLARLHNSGAVALVTVDATTRRGKTIRMKDTADEALGDAPSVREVIVLRHLGIDVAMTPGRDVFWDDLDPNPPAVPTVSTDSNDPLTVIYTSGTSGPPKGIVHSHAGFLVKSGFDFGYGFDLHEDDVIAWIADMGWMLGPLLILGTLQFGATVVLTEGVPTYPTPRRLWDIAQRHGVTFQGIAPTAARAVMAAADDDFSGIESIRTFASTGEAWDDPTWRWLFDTVGGRSRPILNYSGGTETGGGILVCYPFLPLDPASFNGPLLGMDVTVLDQDGRAVRDAVGDLSVLNTWPGMTHGFWGDDDRYHSTYWEKREGIWDHGDLASVSRDGVWRIHGRSDDTIKVSGRRIGPAELEAALLKDRRIVEAAVIGIPDAQRGQRVVAFVVTVEGGVDRADLEQTAVENIGRSFAPVLHIVRTLPKTRNGKVVRRVIRARHLGLPPGDTSSLDPLTPLSDIPELAHEGAKS